MRAYELMCVFSVRESYFTDGVPLVRNRLSDFGAVIKSEEDYGDKDLAYEVRKERRGRYYLYTFEYGSGDFVKLEEQLLLQKGLIRYLIVRKVNRRLKRAKRRGSQDVLPHAPLVHEGGTATSEGNLVVN